MRIDHMFGVVTVIRRSQPAQTEDGPDQLYHQSRLIKRGARVQLISCGVYIGMYEYNLFWEYRTGVGWG